MKANELASWLLCQQEDLEVCIFDKESENFLPIEWSQLQLKKTVQYDHEN